MCDFCDYIFDEVLIYKTTHKGSKNNQLQTIERNKLTKRRKSIEDYIFFEDDGIHILVETGDPFCEGVLQNVKFCPYCGRKLSIKENEDGK